MQCGEREHVHAVACPLHPRAPEFIFCSVNIVAQPQPPPPRVPPHPRLEFVAGLIDPTTPIEPHEVHLGSLHEAQAALKEFFYTPSPCRECGSFSPRTVWHKPGRCYFCIDPYARSGRPLSHELIAAMQSVVPSTRILRSAGMTHAEHARLKHELWIEQHGRCRYCSLYIPRPNLRPEPWLAAADPIDGVLDHKQPLSRDGVNERANLALTCHGCNAEKGTMTADEFRAWMGAFAARAPPPSRSLFLRRYRHRQLIRALAAASDTPSLVNLLRSWPDDML